MKITGLLNMNKGNQWDIFDIDDVEFTQLFYEFIDKTVSLTIENKSTGCKSIFEGVLKFKYSEAPEVKYTCMKIADIYLLKDLLIDDKSIKNQLAAYSGQQIEIEIHNQ